MHWHLRQFLSPILFLRDSRSRLFVFGHVVTKELEEYGLVRCWFDIVVFCQFFSFDLIFHIGFGGKDFVGVFHFVELEKFLDELEGILSLTAFC